MVTSWLAVADPSKSWAHHAWTDFASLPDRQYGAAVLPVHALIKTAARSSDLEEAMGSVLLRDAVSRLRPRFPVRVLPPLRFVPADGPESLFGIDFETACELVQEIAAGVRAAGFQKLVFFNTGPAGDPLVGTAAMDIRAQTGMRTYHLDLRALGFDPRAPARDDRSRAGHVAGLLEEILLHHAPSPARAEGDDARPVSPTQPYPAFRSRYLPAATPEQLQSVSASARALAVLPAGAIEQHGPHLPVGVDAILSHALLDAALARLPPEAPVWVTPPLVYGKSNEHEGFPGTVAVSARTFHRLVLAVARQVRALGFRRLAVFNTHGGNRAVLTAAVRELPPAVGLDAALVRHDFAAGMDAHETAWGFHAGEWETSLMLACAPELVRMDRAVGEYPVQPGEPGELRPERSPATFAWITRDLSRSGVIGDPTRATVEKGRAWLDGASTRLAEAIRRQYDG